MAKKKQKTKSKTPTITKKYAVGGVVGTPAKLSAGESIISVPIVTPKQKALYCGNGWLDEAQPWKKTQPRFKSVEEEAFENQPATELTDARNLIQKVLNEDVGKDHPYIDGAEMGTDGRLRVTVRFDGEKYPSSRTADKDHAHDRKYIVTIEEEKSLLASLWSIY